LRHLVLHFFSDQTTSKGIPIRFLEAGGVIVLIFDPLERIESPLQGIKAAATALDPSIVPRGVPHHPSSKCRYRLVEHQHKLARGFDRTGQYFSGKIIRQEDQQKLVNMLLPPETKKIG
jgi:hypothetical protein